MQISSTMSTISTSNMNLWYNQEILDRTNSKCRRLADNVQSNYNRITFLTYMRMPTPPEGCYPHTSPLFVHPRREPYSFPEQQTDTIGYINRRFFLSGSQLDSILLLSHNEPCSKCSEQRYVSTDWILTCHRSSQQSSYWGWLRISAGANCLWENSDTFQVSREIAVSETIGLFAYMDSKVDDLCCVPNSLRLSVHATSRLSYDLKL